MQFRKYFLQKYELKWIKTERFILKNKNKQTDRQTLGQTDRPEKEKLSEDFRIC